CHRYVVEFHAAFAYQDLPGLATDRARCSDVTLPQNPSPHAMGLGKAAQTGCGGCGPITVNSLPAAEYIHAVGHGLTPRMINGMDSALITIMCKFLERLLSLETSTCATVPVR